MPPVETISLSDSPVSQAVSAAEQARVDYQSYVANYEAMAVKHSGKLTACLAVFDQRPYVLDPIGDGVNDHIDARPLVNTTAFDCMTLCSTVIAMVASKSFDDFLSNLDRVRYGSRPSGYLNRHHFIESQWNVSNRALGFLKNQMPALSSSGPIDHIKQYLNYPAWLEQQQDYLQKNHGKTVHLADTPHAFDYSAPDTVTVDTLSLDHTRQALQDSATLALLDECVMQLVCPNWAIEEKIGTSIAICHLGVTTLRDGQLYFTHAKVGHRVVTTLLQTYLDEVVAHLPHVTGIRFERILYD